jgi:ATP-dependent helicase/nuclease subunit A
VNDLVHRVCLASAGTGKTYQLTNRALGLLLRDVEPQRVLATTFTRKAAGEILNRMLSRLSKAAENEDELADLNGHLGDLDLTPGLCVRTLCHLMRHIDRLSVQTLDSFFVQLAGYCALDLGLPPGWAVADETEVSAMRLDALGRVVERAEPDELIELMRVLQRGGAGSSVYAGLERGVTDAYRVFLQSPAAAWEALKPPPGLSVAELAQRTSELRELTLPLTKAGAPDKTWAKARKQGLDAVLADHWELFLKKGLGKAVIEVAGIFSKHPIEGAAAETLAGLVEHAKRQVVLGLLARGKALHGLLTSFHDELSTIKREQRRYEFDDVPRALGGSTSATLVSETLTHRADTSVDHLLLDEFQDTSVLQARVLKPLIARVMEGSPPERSFFCVGDVKQSIYAWRQGESRLLTSLSRDYPALVETTLEINYRSCSVVLETVDKVFGQLADSPVFEGKGGDTSARQAAQDWQDSFRQPEAHDGKLPGSAHLIEVKTDAKTAAPRLRDVNRFVVRHVAGLVRDDPQRKVGILVRRKAPIAALIRGLMDEGVAASGEGGNPLTDSEAVRLALSLLTLADHPGDTVARFHVATSAFAQWFENDSGDLPPATAWSAGLRRRLLEEGYGGLLGWLQTRVATEDRFDGWDRIRFEQLVDLGFAYDGNASLRPRAFVDRVWEQSVEAPTDATVKVMTIHAAKGLEFDVVVLPDLESKLFKSTPPLLARQQDPWKDADLVIPAGPMSRLDDVLDRMTAEAKGRALQEELCVLYVAMTRAVRRLDMIVGPPVSGGQALSFAGLLRDRLLSAGDGPQGEEGASAEDAADVDLAEDGELTGREIWHHPSSVEGRTTGGGQAQPEDDVAAGPSVAAGDVGSLSLAPSRRPRWMTRRTPSGLEGGRVVRAVDLLELGGSSARGRGLLIHAWLQQVEWMDDFQASDETLLARGRRVARAEGQRLDEQELMTQLGVFRAHLQQPQVASLLARPADVKGARGVDVWRERRFAVRMADEMLLRGSFDRVVVFTQRGKPVRADVIDFKTDRVSGPAPRTSGQQGLFDSPPAGGNGPSHASSSLADRVDRYRPQMDAYRDVVTRLTGLGSKHIRCRLAFLVPDTIVDL